MRKINIFAAAASVLGRFRATVPNPVPGPSGGGIGLGVHTLNDEEKNAALMGKSAEPTAAATSWVQKAQNAPLHFELPSIYEAIYTKAAGGTMLLDDSERAALVQIDRKIRKIHRQLAGLTHDAIRIERTAASRRARVPDAALPDDDAKRDPSWIAAQVRKRRSLRAHELVLLERARPHLLKVAGRVEAIATSLLPKMERQNRAEHAAWGGKPEDWTPPPMLCAVARCASMPSGLAKQAIERPKFFLRRLGITLEVSEKAPKKGAKR